MGAGQVILNQFVPQNSFNPFIFLVLFVLLVEFVIVVPRVFSGDLDYLRNKWGDRALRPVE
ncbi:hypothetical protein DVK03_19175 [Haloferax sp. Atlit-109R]|nr:hypothetical protein C5B88_18690 [Haloferax sp. Atlit-24N]RLM33253.1 hypothetical protein DVK03_19175 [Haloferax sp. Atlit-109R]RLM40709.1 hypothetical protein DVK04_19150 [Haloferax sp. Atlit-105R]